MPEFSGFLTPILAAFDPDGRKTDKIMGKNKGTPNADGGGNTPNGDPGDPNYNSHPEYGPWSDAKRQQVGEQNMQVIAAAKARQDQLEGMGARYDDSNGTWILPDGRTTTLMPNDPGPPGVPVTHNWGRDEARSDPYQERSGDFSGKPRKPWGNSDSQSDPGTPNAD